ncbi:hypothetical protein AB0D83_01035 [Streptomyces decoyicus]|uniref:hypothetical protein n=1 Tax=Streptomyces decoyicus TaxID=249567 RepID=UPI0033CD2065
MRKLNLFFLMLVCRIEFRMSNCPVVARSSSSRNTTRIGGVAVVLLALVRAECGGLFPVAPIECEPVIGYAGQTVRRSEVALSKTDLAVEILTAQQIRVCWRPWLASPHV